MVCSSPPDDVDALVLALRKVVKDYGLRRRLGDAALERARLTFNADVVWHQFDNLYRDLIEFKGRTSERPRRFGEMLRRQVRRSGPLRILFIVPDLRVGGAERHVATLLSTMDRSRFTPSVICIGKAGELYDELAAADVPSRVLGKTKRECGHTLVQLIGHMRRTRPDIVVTRCYNAEVLGRIAGILTRVPRLAVWVHNCDNLAVRGRVQRLTDRLLDPFTSAYYGVSRSQIKYLTGELGYPAAKVRIVPNGTNPNPVKRPNPGFATSLGIRPDDLVVGIIARLCPEKDHSTLLRAARLVIDEEPRTRFLVVGDGSQRTTLEGLATKLQISERIIFTGSRLDVGELLAVMDVFALSSYTEASPIALLEAMAAALPAVCTAVGGIPEMIVDGITGYLVPPRDSRSLADRLIDVLRDQGKAREMGQAARERVAAKFTLDCSVRTAESSLEELAGRFTPVPSSPTLGR